MEYILGIALFFFVIKHFLIRKKKAWILITKTGCFLFLSLLSLSSWAASGKWISKTTGTEINYTITEAITPLLDYSGRHITVVYLENLGFKKLGQNSNANDVAWLLSEGYRVIELNYDKNCKAISPNINEDIIAINDAIAAGSFCELRDCSMNQSYVLFEGYRIARNVPYFKDNPNVYNTPVEYTIGDMLHMDIIYPANTKKKVPIILSFSYSNSHATYDSKKGILTDANKDQRLYLPYSLAGFNDSVLEGAPANGMAWAIADHPKYCPWGKGKPVNGANDVYKSYEVNPDAAQKVKSAIRTLRAMGSQLGLSGKIGLFGFSRGSTAGSMAIGDKIIPEIENAGFNLGFPDDVQAAALGPGVFDYTKIYNTLNDGDSNLEMLCPKVWGPLETNHDLWQTMGSSYLVATSVTAPVLFFYNTDDDLYYQDQIAHLKTKLDSLQVPTDTLVNYGTGHSIPQTSTSLTKLYTFFKQYLNPPKVDKRKK
jgi:dienelactone hydrolase